GGLYLLSQRAHSVGQLGERRLLQDDRWRSELEQGDAASGRPGLSQHLLRRRKSWLGRRPQRTHGAYRRRRQDVGKTLSGERRIQDARRIFHRRTARLGRRRRWQNSLYNRRRRRMVGCADAVSRTAAARRLSERAHRLCRRAGWRRLEVRGEMSRKGEAPKKWRRAPIGNFSCVRVAVYVSMLRFFDIIIMGHPEDGRDALSNRWFRTISARQTGCDI